VNERTALDVPYLKRRRLLGCARDAKEGTSAPGPQFSQAPDFSATIVEVGSNSRGVGATGRLGRAMDEAAAIPITE
jgi:hypothetical protein